MGPPALILLIKRSPEEGSGCRYSNRDTLRLLVSVITLLPIVALLYHTSQ